MKLPGGEQAVVNISKLRDYCLNPLHPRGRHKAYIFASILGLTSTDAAFLRDELLRAARDADVTEDDADKYGQRYIIDFELTRNDRQAVVRSAWILRRGELFPRMLSCYVLLN
jgi:hypothetical protein